MTSADSHLLLETTDEPDCRFAAAWLFRAARAQNLWMKALDEPEFADHVMLLNADGIPNIAAFALEIFGELERQHLVAVMNLHEDSFVGREFGLMERLGFFVYGRESYRMILPKAITLAAVRRAALEVVSTTELEDGIETINPENLLQTLPKGDAEAMRARLMALRRFNAVSKYETLRMQARMDHAEMKQ
jgi:hypothetical protein